MSSAKKQQDYGKLFKEDSQNTQDKADIEQLRAKLIEELKNPEKAKKAALYIEHLINSEK